MEEEQKKKKVNWFPGHMKSAMEDIEETKIKLADCILYVLDARAPFACMNPNVNKIVHGKPVIYVFNKIDRLEAIPPISNHLERESCIYISAAGGQNLDGLLALMEQKLVQNITCTVVLPMDKAGLVNQAYASGQVTELEYTDTAVQFVWHGRQEALPHVLAPYTEIK